VILKLLQTTVDGFYATLPRRAARADALRECKIIGHRGQHDGNRSIKENTLAAFRACLDADVWGVEMDIQWTRDGEPVILHDEHGLRVFNDVSIRPSEMSFADLSKKCPDIPSLEQVIDVLGGRIHLMLELKPHGFKAEHIRRLTTLLQPLEPRRDYHLLSIYPEIFDHVGTITPQCFLPVAQTNTTRLFKTVLDKDFGGLTGHYLLLNRSMRTQLAQRKMKWGTGFVRSTNVMHREASLGTNWVFTNCAVTLQTRVNDTWNRR